MFTHPGKKLLFMGADIAQWSEWSEARSLDWHLLEWEPHKSCNASWPTYIGSTARNQPCGRWISLIRVLSGLTSGMGAQHYCLRAQGQDPSDHLVVVCNFAPLRRDRYRIGVPEHCHYAEVLNSDAEIYWGSNAGNRGGFWSDPIPWQGQPCSLEFGVATVGGVRVQADAWLMKSQIPQYAGSVSHPCESLRRSVRCGQGTLPCDPDSSV